VRKLSPSEIYAVAAAILLLLLAYLNNPWLMLVVGSAGLAAGLILARRPAAPARTTEPGRAEGQEGMFGSLRRAAVFGLVGFAVAIAFAVIILLRG
jgi:hypothetical protein